MGLECAINLPVEAWWPRDVLATKATKIECTHDTALCGSDATRVSDRRQQVKHAARLNRAKKKRERDDLLSQIEQLSSQAQALRARMKKVPLPSDKASKHGTWQERALAERRKLAKVMQENAMLRDALYGQHGYIHDLRSVFSSAPRYGNAFSLLEVLHSYTHLGRTTAARQHRLAQVCSETQLAMTEDIVCRETAHMDRCNPSIATRNWVSADRFGSNHCGLFVVDTADLVGAFTAVRQSIQVAASVWPNHRQSARLLDPLSAPTDEMYYGRATTHYHHEHADLDEDEAVVVAEDSLFFSRLKKSHGVMLMDFVDADDLFPVTDQCHFRRGMVGGVLVTLEKFDDGVQRVVVRFVSTKCLQRSTFGLSLPVQRFQDTEDDGRRGCSMSLLRQVQASVKAMKREHEELVLLVQQLSAEVKALRTAMVSHNLSRHGEHATPYVWHERALLERRRLEQAAHDNATLRDDLIKNYEYMHELRSVFSTAPTFGGSFSLLEVLHSYTHLGRNSASRQQRLAKVCSDAQLALTQQIIRRETRHLDPSRPSMTTENWVTVDRFGSNHCALFVVDTVDLERALSALRRCVKLAASAWPHHHESMCVLEPILASSDELYYGRATVHYRHEEDLSGNEEAVIVAADTIYFSHLTPTYGIMVMDFVDADDLFPVTDCCHFRRDIVGGILVTRETSDDGGQHLVIRCIATKCHRRSALAVTPSVERFQDTEDDGRLGCSVSLLRKMHEHIATQD
ncbi:TPA: hypothetical protein N0F65_006232 [Lagenidium giganteum]|uniref:BZIP domain-containing protein n=1 Tax=Lagenidium giganteum TaxID=4803 RepID=A0AAV2Z0W2_9STRA|nr:TPA: hypothetical protein N0F65_006232 [Lagenidium giganteum]